MKNSGYTVNRTVHVFILTAGIISSVLGFLSLLGWILNIPFLTSLGANLIPMAPSAALLFIVMGIIIYLQSLMPQNRRMYYLSMFIGLLVSIIGLLLFILSLAGIYPHFEHLGLSINKYFDGLPVGHISPATAIGFVVCALSFLLSLTQSDKNTKRAWTALVLAFLVIIISMLFLIAYLFVSPLLYGSGVIPPSLLTSLAFFILSVGLLVSAGLQIWTYDPVKDASMARVPYVLLLIFILLAIGIVTGGYFAYQNYEKNFRTQVENQLNIVAELKVDQLDQWRKERLGDANVFYRNSVFSSIVKRYFKNKNDLDVKTKIQTWIKQVHSAYDYNNLCLYDTARIAQIYVPNELINTNQYFSIYFSQALSSGKIVFQDFYFDKKDKRIYLTIFIPILDEYNSNVVLGILAFRIDPTKYLYPLIGRWPTPSKTAETLIFRREGNDVLFLNELRFQKNTSLNLRIPLTKSNVLAVKAVLRQEGVIEGVDYRGVPVIGYVRAVPNSPWFIVARIDMKESFAQVREQMWLIVFLVVVLLIGSSSGVALIWRQQRNRFYQNQYKSAEALRQSEAKYRSIFDNATEGIFQSTPEGKFLSANPAMARILGFSSPEELINGRTDIGNQSYVHPEQREEFKQLIEQQNKISGFEYEVPRKDGSVVWVSETTQAVRDATDHIMYYEGIFINITERKQAEEALKNERLLLRTLIDHIPDSIYSKDTACRKTIVNLTDLRYSGAKSEAEILGKTDFDFYPKELAEGFFADDQSVMQSGKPVLNKEEYVIDENGHQRWLLTSKLPLKDEKGNITGIVGIGRDITDRKYAEEEIQKRNEQFKIVWNGSLDGMRIMDESGKIIMVNDAFCNMIGLERQQLEGAHLSVLFHKSVNEIFDPNEQNSKMDVYKQRFYDKKIEPKFERELHLWDGRKVWFEVTNAYMEFERGKTVVLSIFRDITVRKQTEKALRESERLLKESQQIGGLGTYVLEIATGMWTSSAVLDDIFGIDKEYVRSVKGWETLIHSEWRDELAQYFEDKVIGNRSRFDKEYKIVRFSDKQERWVHGIGELEKDENGRLLRMIGTIMDITERKQIELIIQQQNNQLQELNASKDKFFSIIAHDLKSPFNGFLNLTKIMATESQDFTISEFAEFSLALNNSAVNLYKLLENLLDWSIMQQGKISFNLQKLNLKAIVSQNISTIMDRAKQKGISIFNQVEDSINVSADEQMINTVLRNLISNAVKFTRKDGTITVNAKSIENEMLEISVSDTGVGISDKDLKRLFKIGEQVSSKGTEGESSTGLGLLLSKEFVEKHNGKIWVESKENVGSTFYFTLQEKK
ncbi:MAG: PAS domain S-box protein [Ignavibacteriales bacterium]|nr:PAS domain S-box protein [Ignavibacteriales bacterium]